MLRKARNRNERNERKENLFTTQTFMSFTSCSILQHSRLTFVGGSCSMRLVQSPNNEQKVRNVTFKTSVIKKFEKE